MSQYLILIPVAIFVALAVRDVLQDRKERRAKQERWARDWFKGRWP